ncbi:MAG: 50S ribosomal protein L6 [Planctomycetota bacterium]|jgi:large subunit ribosomal protein L6
MSRVGKNPIALPSGVQVNVANGVATVKGGKGEQSIAVAEGITVAVDGSSVVVGRESDVKEVRALHGTIRALIQNAVTGVTQGFSKQLEIVGVGYRAQLQGKKLVLNIGFCHTVEIEAPEGITFTVPEQTKIEVSGVDRQLVGQVAADIRAVRKPEPYKGKGIRYAGEQVRRKAGKQAK